MAQGALRFRGIDPFTEQSLEFWVVDGRITFEPVASAETFCRCRVLAERSSRLRFFACGRVVMKSWMPPGAARPSTGTSGRSSVS